jgi:hypothetical protein
MKRTLAVAVLAPTVVIAATPHLGSQETQTPPKKRSSPKAPK